MSLNLEAKHQQFMTKKTELFFWSSFFLSKAESVKLSYLFSFCEHLDEVGSDLKKDPLLNLRKISWEVQNTKNFDPWICDFKDKVLQKPVSLRAAEHLVNGSIDGLDTVRMYSQDDLLVYCYKKAGTVAVVICSMLNLESKKVYPYAIDLGIAMYLTNICRDIHKDSLEGRVYLASDILRSYDIDPSSLVSASYDLESLKVVVAHHIELAADFYRSARMGYRFIPFRKRLGILIMSKLHQEIGVELAARGYDPTQGSICIGFFRKMKVIVSCFFSSIKITAFPGALYPSLSKSKKPLVDLPGVDVSRFT